MDWALNEPINGSYASGKLKIGIKGDFVTSPSLGPEFSDLLGIQIAEWIIDFEKQLNSQNIISLVEIGPGEGDLAFNLIQFLKRDFPKLLDKIELVMVELNDGLKKRQKLKLASISEVPIKWESLDKISKDPLTGIFLAHEVLDALPVDILIWENNDLFLQGIELTKVNNKNFINYVNLPLPSSVKQELAHINSNLSINIPPFNVPNRWKTEWHIGQKSWFKKISACIKAGNLLIVDYALEASRYYHASRSEGTLISYKEHTASPNVLDDIGSRDITAHLCLETLISTAISNDFIYVGETKQGLSLLSLGLSKKLNLLQKNKSENLAKVLESRENLLRLVDPMTLGDFRWILFKKNIDFINTRFLDEPMD